MIVIYTGDIQREQVINEYDLGAVKINIEPAFLSELNSEDIMQHLKEKVSRNELLTDEELMEFIILPLSYKEKEEKEKRIYEIVSLAVQIQNRDQQIFILSGILTFTDKIIDRETANKIRRAIEMTQVAQIFEEEKQLALSRAAKKSEEEKQLVIIKMINKGYSTEEIVSLFSDYSKDDIEMLRKK